MLFANDSFEIRDDLRLEEMSKDRVNEKVLINVSVDALLIAETRRKQK